MDQLNKTSQNLNPAQPKQFTFDPIQQLQLKLQNKNKDSEDYQQLVKILTNYLSYPSHQLGELHMQADRLGTRDLTEQIKQRVSNSKEGMEERQNLVFCPCCGFVKQTQTLKICTNLSEINNIGISTYLYFQTIKNLIWLLLILTLGYSIYALITNSMASGVYNKYFGNTPDNRNVSISYVSISLGSKQMNPTTQNATYYLIQCWIGIGIVTAWMFLFFILKYFEKEKEEKVEEQTISASDFTVMIEGLPTDLTKEELQASFKRYQQSFTNIPAYLNKPLTIAKINKGKPFYLNQQDFKDDQLDQLKQKHQKLKQTFIGWIQQRQDSPTFSVTKQQRSKKYTQYEEVVKQQMKKYEQIGKKIQQKIKQQTSEETTTYFVTFQTALAMRLFSRLNDPTLAAKIRYYMTCCQGHNKYHFLRGDKRYSLKIERAPEPEDIIWTNLSVSFGQAIKRKIITFTVTFILLGASFGIVYGLSKAQKDSGGNSIISLAISVTISVINIILEIVINKLSVYELDFTITKYQTSLALKSIVASLINSILIPIIVSYYIKDDIYSDKGLASDVFMLGLTNSILPPILKFVNISYAINRIKKYFASKPNNRLTSNQRQLNEKYEYIPFQVGLQYVYLVSLYIFTCFFVSMQPIISVFAISGLGLMYWAQKHALFNRMNRPVPGTDLVNVSMFQMIILGGLVYSLGSLTWSNFMPSGIPKYALLPNLIAVGVSIVTFILPYRAIFVLCSDETQLLDMNFNQKRLLLPSQYDRLNPATSAEAFKQFQAFYEKQLKNFEKASQSQKQKLIEQIAKQQGRGFQRPPQQMMQNNPFNSLFQQGPPIMPAPQMMGSGFQPMIPGFQPMAPGFQPMAPGFQPMAPGLQPQFRPMIPGFQPMGPGFQQPGFQRPGFQQPGFQQPGFQQPGFQQPGFQQPRIQPQPPVIQPPIVQPPPINQPGFQQPGFQQPGYQQRPGFQQPGFQQPGFQQPGFQQPGFQQPGFQQPGFQQPGFQQRPPQANYGFPNGNNQPFGFR